MTTAIDKDKGAQLLSELETARINHELAALALKNAQDAVDLYIEGLRKQTDAYLAGRKPRVQRKGVQA